MSLCVRVCVCVLCVQTVCACGYVYRLLCVSMDGLCVHMFCVSVYNTSEQRGRVSKLNM